MLFQAFDRPRIRPHAGAKRSSSDAPRAALPHPPSSPQTLPGAAARSIEVRSGASARTAQREQSSRLSEGESESARDSEKIEYEHEYVYEHARPPAHAVPRLPRERLSRRSAREASTAACPEMRRAKSLGTIRSRPTNEMETDEAPGEHPKGCKLTAPAHAGQYAPRGRPSSIPAERAPTLVSSRRAEGTGASLIAPQRAPSATRRNDDGPSL